MSAPVERAADPRVLCRVPVVFVFFPHVLHQIVHVRTKRTVLTARVVESFPEDDATANYAFSMALLEIAMVVFCSWRLLASWRFRVH